MFFTLVLFVFCQGVEWNYIESSGYGPSYWSTLYSECAGDRQSPIDIITDTSNNDDIEELDYSETCTQSNYINFELTHTSFRIYNTGHGFNLVAIDENGDDRRSNTTTIARLKNTFDDDTIYHNEYCLDSTHFHMGPNTSVGSEHLLNGKQYPLEGHFVFYSCNYQNISEALTAYVDDTADIDTETESDTNVLAVLGIFYNVNNNDLDNAAFTHISSSMDDILYEEDGSQEIIIDMSGFFGGEDALNEIINSVYIYEGSLTTPPCYEAVLWHVSTKVQTISEAQLTELYKLVYENSTYTIGDFGNFRPVQDVNDRVLYEQECKSNGYKISFILVFNILLFSSIIAFVK